MDAAALFDPVWQQMPGLPVDSSADNVSTRANSDALGAPEATTVQSEDASNKSAAKMEVKAENSGGGAPLSMHNALAANKDANALLQAAAAAAATQAQTAAAASAVSAFYRDPISIIAAAQHMTAQAAKHNTSVSSLRFKSKAVGGGVAGFFCQKCSHRHDGPSRMCTSCKAKQRAKYGTSQSKCDEMHFPNIAAALKYIETLGDCEYVLYVYDHKGDRTNHGKSVTDTNLRVRLVCHCHYKPSKEQKAKIEAQRARTSSHLSHTHAPVFS